MTAAVDDRRRSRIPDHEARGVDDGAPDMSELKPCPFCGDPPEMLSITKSYEQSVAGRCRCENLRYDCPIAGLTMTTEQWNARVSPSKVDEGRAQTEERLAKFIHDEIKAEAWFGQWPECPDDDGYRGGGAYAHITAVTVQEECRDEARRILQFLSTLRAEQEPDKGGV